MEHQKKNPFVHFQLKRDARLRATKRRRALLEMPQSSRGKLLHLRQAGQLETKKKPPPALGGRVGGVTVG